MTNPSAAVSPAGLLGDTPSRDYSGKLSQFNSFAQPELRRLIENLGLSPGMNVLDAGCGTGKLFPGCSRRSNPSGHVVGIDLAAAHVALLAVRFGISRSSRMIY